MLGKGVIVLEEGVGEFDGIQGVPQGGVRDIGSLPDRFSRWEEEQPRLNDGEDGSPYAG